MDTWTRITYTKVTHSPTHTTMVLGTEEKKFAIYMDTSVGPELEKQLAGKKKTRPSTFDLLQYTLSAGEITPLQVVIYATKEAIYYTKLFLEKKEDSRRQIWEIDSRPSDSLSLALIHKIPIYCYTTVLSQAPPHENSNRFDI